MPFFYLDGNIFDSEIPSITADNRSFRYGDGLFESIRMIDWELPFINEHIDRLTKGMQLLGLIPKDDILPDHLSDSIKSLVRKNEINGNARIRLVMYREGDGYYFPTTNSASLLIEAAHLPNEKFILNEEGLAIGIYNEGIFINRDKLSNCKSNNGLPYIMATLFMRHHDWDDCLLLNRDLRIVEATSSNVFTICGNSIKTPSLSEGCVAGILREKVIEIANKCDLNVQEGEMTEDDLLTANEVLLTNAIEGIKWVGTFNERSYGNEKAKDLIEMLNKMI